MLGFWSGWGWRLCLPLCLRGGESGLGLGGGAIMDLTWWWRWRLVAGGGSGLSWIGLVLVWLVGFLCSGFSVFVFLWVLMFVLSWFYFDFYVSGMVRLWAGGRPRGPGVWVSGDRSGAGGGEWSAAGCWGPTNPLPSNFIAGRLEAALLLCLL